MKYFCPPTYNPAEFYVNVLEHADTDEIDELVKRSTAVIQPLLENNSSIDRHAHVIFNKKERYNN